MSTNSLVAYMNKDWKVTSSYVHWDGHTTGVGEVLLDNYNTKEKAQDLAMTLGYALSLRGSVKLSHEDRANTDEPIVYENYLDFEDYIRESSYIEYVYVWAESTGKWQVATWENTKSDTPTEEGFEFLYNWNGFEDLIPVFVREGGETVERMRKLADEGSYDYNAGADELERSIKKWDASLS